MKETITGLVIRTLTYGESGKILTLLTAQGKRTVTVNGARGIKSRFILLSQLFSYGEYTVDVKGTHAYVSDVSLIENFYELQTDPVSLALGSYFCEIAGQICVENSDESEMLSLVLNCLYALSVLKLAPSRVKLVFEARVLANQGVMPELHGCRECGELPKDEPCYLDVMNGSLICPSCMLRMSEEAAKNGILESEIGTAHILRVIEPWVREPWDELLHVPAKKIFRRSFSPETEQALGTIIENYMQHHLECRSDALHLYRQMCGNRKGDA